MAQSAYIKLVTGSEILSISLEEVKAKLLHYREQLAFTAKQLGWQYDEAGFPYTIETKPDADGKWFYLKGTDALYKYILFAVGTEQLNEVEQHFIHIVLPDDATHGDKAKANEFIKHLGKQLKAEIHLFNRRIMYFNSRK
jgi:hypothetical protein